MRSVSARRRRWITIEALERLIAKKQAIKQG